MEAATFCFVSLLTFCFLSSMALMLGYYGSVELAVGPGCSRLVQASSVFVRGIKVRVDEGSQGNGGRLELYGLAGAPPLDVPAEWSEARRVVVPVNSHREWVYILNKGAQIEVAYSVKSETDAPYPLCVIIAQGKESFIQWTEKPSVHNTTVSWHLVQGNGTIEQTVDLSSEYYIAVHNLNDRQDTTLDFGFRTLSYNTTGAEYRCSPAQHICTYILPFLGQNVAVLSSGLKERLDSDEQYVKVSYEPRWIVYVVGSAVLAVALLLLYEILNMLFGACTGGGGGHGGADRRAPLLANKEEDSASLGSSYDSVSHDGDDEGAEERGEGGREGCVVCCDAPKDCFFLPCGHSATCYACGARIVEEGSSCPFCRRKLKKVRRIFAV
ncbi:E3 ubiquitin-protein ligase APD2-like isoform X2 [Phragmites australis]|uniref:E3 ubiquitin-protein ligase APD2-like isoform X2 n=1 Tax=Phragmites australis TaxID=29695 RepID=UPI002D789517|nr:E3 ubiquitin-protein ligase APD2-like isoform X2 [Phragmites australis]